MTEKTPLIKVEGICKSFGKGDAKVDVLNNIDLDIYSGEFVVFFGPSGCGKSTLLNCVAGLEIPDKGRIVVRGDDLSKLNKAELAKFRNKKIGIIFQQFNVLKSFNVLENIALPQTFGGVSKGRRLKRAAHLLEMFGLSKLAKRIPTEISGGQQLRVAIARSLVNNPWILICDEPTGNLDSKASDEVMELLNKLNAVSKRTVVLVTHNPDHLKFAHRVVYLKDGQISKIAQNKSHDHVDMDKIGDVSL
jgi:putative ABC transport system ATP-binding protein